MKVKLIFPPNWEVSQPYLSLPSLAAYLRERDIEAEQIDLNIEVYDKMLSKSYLQYAKSVMDQRRDYLPENARSRANSLAIMYNHLLHGLEQVKEKFRSEQAWNIETYLKCKSFLEHCLEIWSLAYYPESLKLGLYISQYDWANPEQIIQSVAAKENHIFYPVMSDLLDSIVQDADLIGISVSGISQIIPTFILAAMMKEKDPSIKICLGGSIVTRWKDRIHECVELFNWIDYIIVFEGEEALYQLIQTLESGNDVKDVPNLIYFLEKEGIQYNAIKGALDVNQLPCPEFNERYFDQYFSPDLVLPMLSSRGCYWGQCAFCDHSHIYQGNYQRIGKSVILRNIQTLVNKYQVYHFNFHDEAIKPEALIEIVEVLEEQKDIHIRWTCDLRFDNKLSIELFQRAYQVGLRVVYYGLESFNQRVLQLMKKGTRQETIQRILHDSSQSGIWNHLFFFTGFPTETKEEAQQTLAFMRNNPDLYKTSGGAQYSLGIYSPVAQCPEQFSVRIKGNPQRKLALTHEFDYLEGTDLAALKEFQDETKLIASSQYTDVQKYVFRDHWVFVENFVFPQSSAQQPHLKPWIEYWAESDDLYVADYYNGKIYTLTLDTLPLLQYLQSGLTVAEIIQALSEEYHVGPDLIQDRVRDFIKFLQIKELVS